MAENELLVCLLEGMTEAELKAWDGLKRSARKHGIQVLEVKDKDSLELEHQKLVEQGWQLYRGGSSIFTRVSSYVKK